MLNQNKHRMVMFQLLNCILHSNLKDYLAFKWWTLCYFLYQLPRFSTDLDFDCIKEYPNLMEEMESLLLSVNGITIKDKKDKQFTYFFLINYWEWEHNIKIEISKKIYKNTHYETINFFWKPIIAMEKSSIFANKLVALSERLKNRDLFDVYYFFSENFPINEDVIEERTKMKAIEFYKHIYAELPKHYTPNTILAELWDLISEKQKAFMKTKIVNEVQWYLQYKIFEKQNPL